MRDVASSDDFLTAMEAAKLLGVSDTAVRKRIASGSISATKNGSCWRIPRSELERLLNESDDISEPNEPERANPNADGSLSSDARHIEIDRLRLHLEAMTERALSAEKRLERALDSIQALTEQNERLTILLANEQALRIPALPNPLGWIARLFGRRSNA